MAYYVYILRSLVDESLYTGQTKNLKDRLSRHNRGMIRSTKAKAPFELGYFEVVGTRAEAMWREWELKKQWNTLRKKRAIAEFDTTKIKEILGL